MSLESESPQENPITPNASGESNAQQTQGQPHVPISAGIPATPPAKSHCEITCKTEKTTWDKFKDGAEIVGICLLAVYTLYSIKMYCANKRAADAATKAANVASRQMELTQRPWVFVKEARVVSPLIFDNNGAEVTVEITVHNSGLSPASNVSVIPKLYPLHAVEPSESPIEGLCNATSYTSSNAGLLVFPNTDGPPQSLTFGLGKKEIQENTRHGILVVTPFICVLYRPTFRKDGPGYSSGIQYFLWPTIWPDKTTQIPANQLPLNRNGFFGEEAQ